MKTKHRLATRRVYLPAVGSIASASIIVLILAGCGSSGDDAASSAGPDTPTSSPPTTQTPAQATALRGDFIDRAMFPNPHAHIPAQCYIETSNGAQNACLFCHTDGVANLKLGNNNHQAGGNPNVGNLQAEYAFGVINYPFVANSSINPWINTLKPEVLRAAVSALEIDPAQWDMQRYVREDNWSAAFAQRTGSVKDWDTGLDGPFRLFPGLDPAALPADADGFVRTDSAEQGYWYDGQGHNTGWRAVNFMPYGIFTPFAGSVSGIYVRLPPAFMQNADGQFDLSTYKANLDRVERNVQDRLNGETRYLGAASAVEIVRGQYPLGTEFAHPLHYVDVAADGRNAGISKFPGTRAQRVKEVRWMYKAHPWYPEEFGLALKEESAPVYASRDQGWIENGTGWLLGGWIEDANGALRPQKPSELVQCVSCHSGNVRQSEVGQNAVYTSGSGNTIDSTWALPRKFAGDPGWQEMNYLGYLADGSAGSSGTPGRMTAPEPINRGHGEGEFAFFLNHVVGASLYGDMPPAMENFLATQITIARGYAADWPQLDAAIAAGDIEAVLAAQEQRLALMRAFTGRGEHLDANGVIRPELFLPPQTDSLEGARRYRQVVVTQRYDFGKDVFAETPFTLRYFRRAEEGYTHQDGRSYQTGEVITDRPVNENVADFTYGLGIVPTLIDEDLPYAQGGTFVRDYIPLLEPTTP